MKSILIPTVLESDTLQALETAMQHAKGKSCTIVLFRLHEAPDASSAAEFLRKSAQPLTPAQSELLDECCEKVRASANCKLEIRNQNGISAPLLRNLLEFLGTEMIILTPSYKAGKIKLHKYFCKLLSNCKKPILHLGATGNTPAFHKALYIDRSNAQVDIRELQQMVSRQFDFRIVSQASIAEEQNPEGLGALLTEAISKNGIDLLVETRKPKAAPQKAAGTDAYGLPVLSLCQ